MLSKIPEQWAGILESTLQQYVNMHIYLLTDQIIHGHVVPS